MHLRDMICHHCPVLLRRRKNRCRKNRRCERRKQDAEHGQKEQAHKGLLQARCA